MAVFLTRMDARMGRRPARRSFSAADRPASQGDAEKRRSEAQGGRKRQPQERQHSADAGTAAGRGTDCSRETG
jgi:hypothetical protein